MICIILRNIDTDTTDFDLLLYVYLKVSLAKFSKFVANISVDRQPNVAQTVWNSD
jgi:hypothetical protein